MTFISINGHVIRKNAVTGSDDPPIRVARKRNDKAPRYAREVSIRGGARLVYNPSEPILACGARLVLITEGEVDILR